jgi:hypothetical protein
MPALTPAIPEIGYMAKAKHSLSTITLITIEPALEPRLG